MRRCCLICKKDLVFSVDDEEVSIFKTLQHQQSTVATVLQSIVHPYPVTIVSEIICYMCYTLFKHLDECENLTLKAKNKILNEFQDGLQAEKDTNNTKDTDKKLLPTPCIKSKPLCPTLKKRCVISDENNDIPVEETSPSPPVNYRCCSSFI